MKLFAYNYRDFDEAEFFQKYAKTYGFELGFSPDPPTVENLHLAKGYDAISIITTKVDRPILEAMCENGVKILSTRTIGTDHIDLAAAKELGMMVSNATYSPACVADYAVMMILMAIRKMKRIMERGAINDFTLPGIQGMELHNLTVGVLGTGRIGQTVLKDLSGFGCKLCACDVTESDEAKKYAEYLSFEELCQKCDVITLHLPINDATRHIINKEAIAQMKDGVILVNTARGALIDTAALIEGLESGKVGGAGIDVIENELGLCYFDHRHEPLKNRELAVLRNFPNVVVTPHMAFYTDQATDDMVHHSVLSCLARLGGKEDPWKIL